MDLMRRGPNREAIDDQVLYEKTIGRILAIARGEEVPEPGAEPPAAEAESETEAEAEAESETQEETVVESEAVDVLEEPAATEGAADPMAEVAEESEGKHS
jgi:hypothetical protein